MGIYLIRIDCGLNQNRGPNMSDGGGKYRAVACYTTPALGTTEPRITATAGSRPLAVSRAVRALVSQQPAGPRASGGGEEGR
jgi:hypothetical protein